MKRFYLSLALPLLLSLKGFTQGEIPVSMYSGSVGISISLFTLTDHDLKEPLSLVYNVNDVNLSGAHRYGVGWGLSAENQQITREVRGLPDDITGMNGTGWLYNNNYSSITSFPNSSNLNVDSTACGDEQADQTFINNLVYKTDPEPDLYTFQVGAYSGSFVFNNTGTISLIPYQDIQIVPTYTNAPTDMTITGWTITTNDGIVYTFNESCKNIRSVDKVEDSVSQTMLTLFDRDYRYYGKVISYSYAWMLSKAHSPSGAYMRYTYNTTTPTTSTPFIPEVRIFDASWALGGGGTLTKSDFQIMQQYDKRIRKTLAQIKTSSGMWATCDPTDGIKIYDSLRSTTTSFKNYVLTYNSTTSNARFLMSVTESFPNNCSPVYKMDYVNVTDYPADNSIYEGNPTLGLSRVDFWGFYNNAQNAIQKGHVWEPTSFPTIYVYPNENGYERYRLYPIPSYAGTEVVLKGDANRMANENVITTGTLSRLRYPSGGEADIVFEANKYYDAKAGKDQVGGGLRVKQVTYFDGINPNANIVKNFTYTDAAGHSSGKLIGRPAFAFPINKYIVPTWSTVVSPAGTYTGYSKNFKSFTDVTSKWRALTAVTNFDISAQSSSVGYTHVTVTRPGSGKAVFDYAVPATYGDAATGATATDWIPTTMKIARPSPCLSTNIITQGEAGGYASFPNPVYDYERGLQLKKSEYNNAGTLVRLTQNTYKYIYKGTQATSVVALAYEHYANTSDQTFLYGRYVQPADVAKVMDTETVTTYDENNAARNLTESTQYLYSSQYHRLVSRINRTTADGTIYGTTFKYVLDYPVTTTVPTDVTLKMIKYLKDSLRYGTMIEQRSTMTSPAGTEVTTGASLTKFDLINNKPLPRTQLVFRPLTPVTNFAASGVDGNYAFSNDSRYETVNTINEYTTFDMPLSATGEDGSPSGSLWGYTKRVPIAQFKNAQASNIGFSDFETKNSSMFTITNGYYGSGRTGLNGIHPYATLVRTVTKPSNATKYLLSFWLKNTASTTITLQVVLTNSTGVVQSTTNYAYTLTGTDYQYFTQLIDVSALTSTFTIQIKGLSLTQPTASSTSLLPMLDDIGFYPDFAVLSSVTYDMPYGVKSSTDPSGKTYYVTYDGLGRKSQMLDQKGNIREQYSYTLNSQVAPSLTAYFATTFPYYVNSNIQFTATTNACLSGVLYSWDFGDGNGFTTPSSSNVAPVKSYAVAGDYTVTLKVTQPNSPTATYATSITVKLLPLAVTICGSGVQTFASGVVTSSFPTDCFTHSGDVNWVAFMVNSTVNTYNSTLTYQWKKRPTGTQTWSLTGTNSNLLPDQKISTNTASFDIMCTVTTSDGRTDDSNVLSVTVTN
ncbi:MAG TPA: PKD domain-containing protein [Cyclobacteriaceae bacterium]